MNTDHFFSLLVTQSVELSAVIAIVWILSTTVFRRRPHLAYALWLVVLAKAVTPPVWSSPTGVFSWALRQSQPAQTIQTLASKASFSAPPIEQSFNPPHEHILSAARPSATPAPSQSSYVIRPEFAILVTWSAGTTLVFATILITTARLRRRMLRSAVDADHRSVRRLAAIIPPGTPRIVVTTELIGPALLGVFAPLIVIPLHVVEALSDRELRAIIAHELTHLRRCDHWVAALQRLVISIGWFNPLIWFAHRQINRTRELCCDEQTVANLDCDPADYAQMLLDVLLLRRGTLSTQALFPGVHSMQITTRRLSALLATRATFTKRAPLSAWVTLIAAALAIIPGSGLVQTLAADAPKTTPQPASRPAVPPIVFHGVLSDLRLRWPIKGATVTVSFSADFVDLKQTTVSTTAADGRFDVIVPRDLAARKPELLISIKMYHPLFGERNLVHRWLPGFKMEAEWVEKNDPNRTTLPRLDIQLLAADQLSGTLVGPDRRPLAEATLTVVSMGLTPVEKLSENSIRFSPTEILGDTVHTDAAGHFTLPAFGGGQTSLLIQPKDAAAFQLNPSDSAHDGHIDIGTITAPAGRPITGTVTNADGKPLAGWMVTALPSLVGKLNPNVFGFGNGDVALRTVSTDAAGRFTLPPVGVGTVNLTVINPSTNRSQSFADGMAVPSEYFSESLSGGISPLKADVSADGPVPNVILRPSPQVRVVIRSTDPQGRPAEPLATFVTGKVNSVAGAWLAEPSGPDTVEAHVPKGVMNAQVGINDLSADDHQTVARVRRGNGPAVDAGMTDLGTLDRDVTDLTVVRFPRPKLTITITDTNGRELPDALTVVRYAKPSPGNPYWDRLTRGSGSPQPIHRYDVFPNQPFTLTTTLDGYSTDTRDLKLDWQTDRTVAIRLTPTAAAQPAKAN